MARIRTIKPEFFTSTTIQRLPIEARLTFIGLFCHADDYGRCEDVPLLVKAAVWPLDPYTEKDVERWLRAIADLGLVIRYEVGGKRLLQITAWTEHQRVNRPTTSKFPPPDEDSVKAHGILTEDSLRTHGGLTEDSLQERKGKEQGKERKGTGRADTEGFDEFWNAYPLKRDKPQAIKAYLSALKRATAETIILGAESYANDENRDPAFTKYPATWLRNECWNDGPLPPRRLSAHPTDSRIHKIVKQMEAS